MKSIKQLCFALLAITVMLSTGCAQANSYSQTTYAQKDLDRMSIFLSNFSELGFLEVTDEFKNDPERYVHFAVRHNYINNFPSRIKHEKDGMLSMDVKYAQDSLKKYLNLEIATWPSTDDYTFEKNKYVFMGADGEMVIYAKVTAAENNPKEGIILLTGYFYNTEDEEDRYGTFEAVVKNHKWNGKNTWYMVEMKHTSAETDTASENVNLSKEDCMEISSRVKPGEITIKNVYENSYALYIAYTEGGDDEYFEQVPYGDLELYNKYKGKTIPVEYTDAQYFDDEEGICIQDRDFITLNGEEAGSSQLLNTLDAEDGAADCFDISTRVKPGEIIVKKTYEANNIFYVAYVDGGNYEHLVAVPYKQYEIFKQYLDKTIPIEYTNAQYFKEDKRICMFDTEFVTINGEEL